MFIPFRRELDDVFRGDRSIGLKMGGCAIATTFIVIVAIVRGVSRGQLDIELSAPLLGVLALASAVTGALLALVLALKDVVQRRVARGEPVNPVLKVSFGFGIWSLLAWFPTVMIAVFVITIAFLSLPRS